MSFLTTVKPGNAISGALLQKLPLPLFEKCRPATFRKIFTRSLQMDRAFKFKVFLDITT